MYALITQSSEEITKSIPGKIGYELGYFLGSYFYETIAGIVLIAGILVYLSYFRKKKNLS